MADEADRASELIDTEISSVLQQLRQQTPTSIGPEACVECDEAIPEARRKMGYRLCVPCAEASERRDALFAG